MTIVRFLVKLLLILTVYCLSRFVQPMMFITFPNNILVYHWSLHGFCCVQEMGENIYLLGYLTLSLRYSLCFQVVTVATLNTVFSRVKFLTIAYSRHRVIMVTISVWNWQIMILAPRDLPVFLTLASQWNNNCWFLSSGQNTFKHLVNWY